MLLKEKAIEIAKTQLGVQEIPLNTNKGPQIKEYLKSVGLNEGFSWCMAYVYWCFKKASEELKIVNTAIKTAGVLDAWNKANIKIKSTTPQIGSVFIMDFGKGQGHTGIVESFDNLYINTIEGNSNDEGSREGYEVCKRKRLRKTIKGYLIY